MLICPPFLFLLTTNQCLLEQLSGKTTLGLAEKKIVKPTIRQGSAKKNKVGYIPHFLFGFIVNCAMANASFSTVGWSTLIS